MWLPNPKKNFKKSEDNCFCFGVIERVSTRVVVVVVVVAQPDSTYTYAHASSVMEPKLHMSLPKHLPLHTEESLEKVHPVTNITNQSLAASLVK